MVLQNVSSNELSFFVNKNLAKDMRLSAHARSLLLCLISMQTDSYFNLEIIQKLSGYTNKMAKRTIKELRENGYMKSYKVKDSFGRFVKFDYIITQFPFAFSEEEIEAYHKGKLSENKITYDVLKSNKKSNGYIYVIEINNNYKIGKSKNLKKRFGEYTRLFEEPKLIIAKNVYGYDEIEQNLHEIFSKKRKRGEWFALNKKDIEFIKDYLNKN